MTSRASVDAARPGRVRGARPYRSFRPRPRHHGARDDLRRILIHDQADRDAISSRLTRFRDERGDDWADIIDMLTMYPEARSSSHLVSLR